MGRTELRWLKMLEDKTLRLERLATDLFLDKVMCDFSDFAGQ